MTRSKEQARREERGLQKSANIQTSRRRKAHSGTTARAMHNNPARSHTHDRSSADKDSNARTMSGQSLLLPLLVVVVGGSFVTRTQAVPIPLDHCPLPDLPAGGHFPAGGHLRSLFQFDAHYRNLNHGSYGSVPAAVTSVRRCWSDHVEAAPDIWYRYDMFETLDLVRSLVAKYINAASLDDVVFVDNASHGVNAVLRSLAPTLLAKTGGKILFLQTAYTMVKNTLKFVEGVYDEQLLQVNISTRPSRGQTFADGVVAAVDAALSAEAPGTVTLASFSHIVSLPAAILPVKRLVQVCRKHGVQVLIDGAHALGQITVDVQDIDADYYVANGHKWLYSPKGSAVLWVRPDKQPGISPTTISYEGHGTTRFQKGFAYQGTQDMTQFMCLASALEFRNVVTGGDDGKIIGYIHDLAVRGGKLLASMWKTEVLLPEDSFAAMVDVRVPSENATLMAELPQLLLKSYGTYVPVYPWNGGEFAPGNGSAYYVRVSAQIYQGLDDFRFLGDAISSIILSSTTLRRGI